MKKKTALIIFLMILLALPSCNMPEKVSEEMVRTFVASTLQAKINAIGSMTPPTPTPTNTEVPTETPTPTVTPTPTIEPTATWTYHERGSAEVFVLYYHDVVLDRDDDPYYQWENAAWYVKPVEFEQQMRILAEMKYNCITINDLVNVVRNGGELPDRPVLITFDSTELGQWNNAYPIMKKYGLFGNLFIDANHVDAKNSLSLEQINTMMADGWGIGSSGYYGNGLNDRSQYGTEIGMSKVRLEELFEGYPIMAFAYPGGYTDPEGEIIRRTSNTYQAAFCTLHPQNNVVSMDYIYFIPRHEITGGMSYNNFFNLLPWKEGSISQETMEWALPTPTLDPAVLELTKQVELTLIAESNY
ncbi:MAG: polysaccharide deacetylase family protein [Anaerolineaceae bacterium]|nr:polysaccharide deacetylase family protein [Anaerolineaceae bacterium]